MQKTRTRALSLCVALTLAMAMFVGAPTAAHAAYSDYDAGDIVVIEAIIDNNGLEWLKASTEVPANVDSTWMATNWPGVTWDSSTPARIVELNLYNTGLTGALDVTGLSALEYPGQSLTTFSPPKSPQS